MNEQSNNTDFDLIIVGGGMVGASLACALGNSPLKIAVIEATPFESDSQPSFDARTLALAYGSRRIFDSLGLWDAIAERGVTPIRRIHVSDRGHAGSSHLDSQSEGVEALGYVAETRLLGQVLHDKMRTFSNVQFICPALVTQVNLEPTRASVDITENAGSRRLTGRLLVAADGGNSLTRQLLGVKTFRMGYDQHAVIANVAIDRPHQGVAYERFTSSGPMALLPSRDTDGTENVFALVWTVKSAERDEVLRLDDAAFLAQLQQRIGDRAGRFVKVGERSVYPLGWMQSREHVRQRLAIIGNAAHTLHPVAGQGFNLGLRDVAVLAQVGLDGVKRGQDPGELELLREYAKWRQRDQLETALFTDGLVRTFSTGFPPLALARNIGLTLVDILPPVKHALARHAMGLGGKLPRLARGLRL
jgi:2-octaprenyl-6-methoxyphenol hydroxylase